MQKGKKKECGENKTPKLIHRSRYNLWIMLKSHSVLKPKVKQHYTMFEGEGLSPAIRKTGTESVRK